MNNEEEEKIIDETESVFANKRNRFSDEAFKNGDEEETDEVPAEDVFTDEDFAGGFQEPENQDGESDVGEIN